MLTEEADGIVASWEAAVRDGIDLLRQAPRAVVLDHVVDVLNALVRGIETRDATPELEALGGSHGVQRASHGVRLRDVVREHRLLRDALVAPLGRRRGEAALAVPPVDVEAELSRLHEGLDVFAAAAVEKHAALRSDARGAVHDRFTLAVAAAGMGIWDYDPALDTFEVDPRARELLGLGADDRPRRREEVLDRLEPVSRAALTTALVPRRCSGLDVEITVPATPEADERWLQLAGRALCDDRGETVRVLGTVLDVTEHRQLERTRDRFLAVLGHDLRSPLNAIAMAAHLLAHDREPAQTAAIAARVANSVRRMEGLIRDLLDFARAAVGTPLPMAPRETSIHAVSTKVLEEVRAAHPGSVVAYLPGEQPDGVWDPARLEQVLANLLNNGLKYGRRGAPVTLRWWRGPDGALFIEVHNDGDPIPKDLQPHVFDAFRMGAQSSASAQASAGVGLYVVAQVVRAHGGEVGLESTADAGTTFRVRLPGSAPAHGGGAPPSVGPARTTPDGPAATTPPGAGTTRRSDHDASPTRA